MFIMAKELDSGIKEMFFSTDKRLNRLRYLKRSVALLPIAIILNVAANSLGDNPSLLYLLFLLAVIVAVVVSCFMLNIRRLHDMNMTGWLSVLGLIPIVDIVFELVLLFKKGTDGDNKYGSDPLRI